MTYQVGQTIAAGDYTNFRGTISPSTAYPSDIAAENRIAALIGVGYGTRGYGQTSTVLPEVVSGGPITASDWNSLFGAIDTINTHTGSGLTIPSAVASGEAIQAFDGSLGRPNLATIISTLDSNRLSSAVGEMALTSKLTSTRTTPWTTTVNHEFTVGFDDENEARYFFNSGGQVYISASKSTVTSNALNNAITQMLSDIGTIKFSANSTTYTGTGGSASAIGYYQLTGTYQQVFFHSGPVGYSAPDYSLQVRSEGITGLNGGNGNLIRFLVTMATNLVSYNTVDGTLQSSVSQLKADGALTIADPTYTTITPL